MSKLTNGDRVIHENTGKTGIISSTNGISAVIDWNADQGNTPLGVLPVEDLVLDLPVPPAGFRAATYLDCMDEFGDIPAVCEPYGSCDCDRETDYHGPNVSAETFSGITSQWTPEKGIFFILQKNDSPVWSREQIAELPAVIDQIEGKIDEEMALDLLRSQAHLLRETTTVNQLCNFAIANEVTASAVFAAYQELTKDGSRA